MFEWLIVLGVMAVLLLIFGISGAIIDRIIPDDETEE